MAEKVFDVFVSYSSFDRDWVEVLVKNLNQLGVPLSANIG